MAKTIKVKPSQVAAARLLVERAELTGTPVPAGMRAIAEAKPSRQRAALATG